MVQDEDVFENSTDIIFVHSNTTASCHFWYVFVSRSKTISVREGEIKHPWISVGTLFDNVECKYLKGNVNCKYISN